MGSIPAGNVSLILWVLDTGVHAPAWASIDSFAPAHSPLRASSMSRDAHRLHSRRERSVNHVSVGWLGYMLSLGLRLIDSNFPVLGLRPASLRLCRTASRWLHSLTPARSPLRASSMSLDAHRLHSRRERLPGKQKLVTKSRN